jgi:hypothetical protein
MTQPPRYLVFAMEFYEIVGGFGDFVDGYATLPEAVARAEAEFARLHANGQPCGDVHVADLLAHPARRLVWINGARVVDETRARALA